MIKQKDTIPALELEPILQLNTEWLYNTNYFNKVAFTQIDTLPNNHLRLHLQLKERWYLWPHGKFKLEDITHFDWLQTFDLHRISYGLGFQFKNITGRMDQLYLNLSGGYTWQAKIGYSSPFALGNQRGVEFYFDFYQNDEVAYGSTQGKIERLRILRAPLRRSWESYSTFLLRPLPLMRLNLTAKYLYTQVLDTLYLYNARYLTRNNGIEYYPILSAFIDYDRRDIQGFPLAGFRIQSSVELCGLPFWGSTQFLRIQSRWTHHVPLFNIKDFTFSYGLYAAFSIGTKIPYYHKFFLGQDITIRGYESFWVDFAKGGAFKSEIKYPIIKRKWVEYQRLPGPFRQFPIGLYPHIYWDIGWLQDYTFNHQDDTYKHKLLLGVGAGFQLYTFYDNVIRLEAGTNLHGHFNLQLNFALSIK